MSANRAPRLIALLAALAALLTACSDSGSGAVVASGPDQPAAGGKVDLVATAEAGEEFTVLLAALEATELTDELSTGGPYTLFAPTDSAFAALPAGLVEELLEPANQELLSSILLHHVGEGLHPEAEMIATGRVPTIEGTSILVREVEEASETEGVAPMTVLRAGDARVVGTDTPATNGAMHSIDTVMIPASIADEVEALIEDLPVYGDVLAMLEADRRFTSLVDALDAADLTAALEAEGPITVIAPTNAAFNALTDAQLDTFEDTEVLASVLKFHVISGTAKAGDIAIRRYFATLEGQGVIIARDGEAYTIEGVEIVEADIEAANGLIHVVDVVLVPTSVLQPAQ